MKQSITWLLILALLCLTGCGAQVTEPTTEPTTVPTTQATEPPPPPRITGERIVDGRSRCTATYRYNDQGQLIRIDRTHNADNSIYNCEFFRYDDQGRLTEEEMWLNQELPGHLITYEYNQSGRLIRITNNKLSEEVWNWYEVCYGASGYVEKYDVYTEKKGKAILVGQIDFTYDFYCRVLTQEERDLEGNLLSCVTNTYNDQGQLIQVETITYDTNFNTRTVDTYEYSADGRCKTLIHEIFSDDLPFSTVKTAYVWE